MKDEYTAGQVVYVYEIQPDSIVKAVIVDKNIFNDGYSIRYQSIVDRDGNEIVDMVGDSCRESSGIWKSAADAYAARNKKHQEKIAAYKNEIKDMKTLILFPLDHCLNGKEYTDYDARIAYKERAKELFGLDLDKENEEEMENAVFSQSENIAENDYER